MGSTTDQLVRYLVREVGNIRREILLRSTVNTITLGIPDRVVVVKVNASAGGGRGGEATELESQELSGGGGSSGEYIQDKEMIIEGVNKQVIVTIGRGATADRAAEPTVIELKSNIFYRRIELHAGVDADGPTGGTLHHCKFTCNPGANGSMFNPSLGGIRGGAGGDGQFFEGGAGAEEELDGSNGSFGSGGGGALQGGSPGNGGDGFVLIRYL